ncbi:hypothetical protein NDU88_011577 [Pleurodeles waltl]|uniref:FBA domain-containing protein n=1 Tax=Pleurodeles waltl TaxID=8319 RepID=A0AAV7R1R5_PLEWA|nr:hypothetical protein NDU88_011577 [Pleurodeles waltl]
MFVPPVVGLAVKGKRMSQPCPRHPPAWGYTFGRGSVKRQHTGSHRKKKSPRCRLVGLCSDDICRTREKQEGDLCILRDCYALRFPRLGEPSPLKKNVLKNPCAEENFDSWQIDSNGGDEWVIEDLPGVHGQPFPQPSIRKYFVTSFGNCKKSQLIDLKKEGYWESLMDEVQPDIVVTDWYAARHDCGCRYEVCVQLLSIDYIVLQEYEPEPVIIEQWSDAKWRKMSHTFRKYGPGVRYIKFQHGGQDTQFWAGWYGVRVTCSSLVIEPPGPNGQ